MEKSTLMGFINRFYLGGQTQSAPVTSTKDKLSCSFINSAKSCVGDIVLDKGGFGDYEMGLYEIQDLIKLLNVLDGEISITADKVGDMVSQLEVKSTRTNAKVNYGLARLDVVSKKPDLTNVPDFGLEIEMDKQFINSFISGKGALSDIGTFAVISDGVDAKVVIGHSTTTQSNKVTIPVDTKKIESFDEPVFFDADTFKEVLSANKDCESATLYVSAAGLAKVNFKVDNFDASYVLVAKTTVD
jgi:hypothetical protein|tara:strand:- start:1235 stop:1966 length:732 start_codon:yes stop_codon:yes gene_type:complete